LTEEKEYSLPTTTLKDIITDIPQEIMKMHLTCGFTTKIFHSTKKFQM